ncbi:integrase arm-type DNA-binding domain-containing protein [Xanthomonas campestris pv. campestris]|uniref:tyrosine-type recombinase/integrase n=1 Tax=Xanthomonas campestris TaxID=339 RepID=UPI001A1286A6|nr:integrase arm-type DNA-binding domain-containing protein [Xanthomonas campestris]MBF9172040.1 integrase arm-type DNA-binding domain-containing protein [Xanthomonas campestris pv. campestris]MDO0846196.1 integrase arm-type DNA-binding domain-containing protein [Xanthomonas campestris pv. campestris]MEB1414325.1 integrase arm-type DNA-binding domain-containing protein [Xanthomonas campestris pv. campestris]MEB1459970.1 integrase arm-type DNA-binding domain-containing protein [Xanthomonas campe
MLTDTKLRALKPKPNVYRVADSNGLAIEVRPTGSKLWRYRYRYAGKASMATLGEYPAVTLSDARIERDRMRVLVRGGANPAHVARTERATRVERANTTFGAIGLELLAKRAKEGLSPGSVKRECRLIEKDLASIADMPITDVSAPILLAALRKLEQRGIIETAHRARAHAGRVFRYAIATGRVERNPADNLAGALEQPKTKHFASLTDPEQIGNLLRALWAYQGTAVTQAALKLAPMLFVRPGELRHAKWAHIDLDAAEWRYVTSKTKTSHIVPLSSQVVTVLQDLLPLTKRSDYVFPGVRSSGRPMSENTINAALRNMGFDGETIVGHGFRAMARTVLDEVLGFRPDYIEHQLAHAVRDPLGRAYNRTAHLPERKKMMQAWADYLDSLRSSEKKVVPIRKKMA